MSSLSLFLKKFSMQHSSFFLVAVALSTLVLGAGCARPQGLGPTATASVTAVDASDVKEFVMDSFFVMENNKPAPQYSLKEIAVKKGEKIRLLVNTKNGIHDLNIDEFNVHTETPTGQVTTIEFTADKAGEFIYYCSKPNHRANGHWGTLKVTE